MKKSTAIALVLFLVILGGGYGFVSFVKPYLDRRALLRTSDAQNISTTLRVGGDNYLGYWFITSPETQKQLARQGIGVDFQNDGGAYADRLQKFVNKELDIIVLPVNSYVDHGKKHNYPGVMVGSIAESKGADGVVCDQDSLPTGKIQDLNNQNLKIIYTGQSPSSFLLDLIIADFDLFQLKNNKDWRVEVASSEEAYNKARRKEGDCFVMWEPDLSRALEIPGIKYVWGSDKFAGYIVDEFVVRRDFLENNRPVVTNFFRTYFRAMAVYANDQNRMIDEMSKLTGLKQDVVKTTLSKIEWFDLNENGMLQFGVSSNPAMPGKDGVIDTILQCLEVMRRTGSAISIDPYLLTNKSIIEELLANNAQSIYADTTGLATNFTELSDDDWKKLREVATIRVEPIEFGLGSNSLSDEDKDQVDKIAKLLIHNYPSYRVVVRGHTGPGSDENENVKLSLERAQVVAQRLIAVHSVDFERLKAEGIGSVAPPVLRPDESPRSLLYRMARVEFVLFEANAF
ncbi:MAG: phosphate ABC transporter substrate-binding/OmpA family protein [Candidatus Taylorbacteria bacterium]|nr:phosphate ABC transporter substrate-binding/OmpA family protein [Candidatus Taylorbacteria bacterium]